MYPTFKTFLVKSAFFLNLNPPRKSAKSAEFLWYILAGNEVSLDYIKLAFFRLIFAENFLTDHPKVSIDL